MIRLLAFNILLEQVKTQKFLDVFGFDML